jgi:hypothetical protein
MRPEAGWPGSPDRRVAAQAEIVVAVVMLFALSGLCVVVVAGVAVVKRIVRAYKRVLWR